MTYGELKAILEIMSRSQLADEAITGADGDPQSVVYLVVPSRRGHCMILRPLTKESEPEEPCLPSW